MSESEAQTRGIHVHVRTRYLPERSRPVESLWVFAYTIRITNRGVERVQLVSRHWIIADAYGRLEEVEGPGVVGEQPTLGPGEAFEYSSGCPLRTSFGSMRGTYRMVTEGGDSFEAEIAEFALTEPTSVQ